MTIKIHYVSAGMHAEDDYIICDPMERRRGTIWRSTYKESNVTCKRCLKLLQPINMTQIKPTHEHD